MKKMIIKGGLVFLLFYFLGIQSVASQNYFQSDTDPGSRQYGEICTFLMNEPIASALKNVAFNFKEWSSFFLIKTKTGSRAVLGFYSLNGNRIVFKPRFLPDPNTEYIISFSYTKLSNLIDMEVDDKKNVQEVISFKPKKTEMTRILKFSPSDNVIPANILRCYLHFSAPMGLKNPYDYIELQDHEGNKINDSFVELPEGLWNEDRTRLTLLFHPGRIKMGVGPNMKQGMILEEEKTYNLIISGNWPDANGHPLTKGFSKKIMVSKAIRAKIDTKNWIVKTNCHGNCKVSIIMDRQLDTEMVKRCITILDTNENFVPFDLGSLSRNKLEIESEAFAPHHSYTIAIHPRMEDVCGNTFLNSFEYPSGTRDNSEERILLRFNFE